MIDSIKSRLAGAPTREAKLHLLREFLQIIVLKILSDQGFFEGVVFLGGTALRILYGLARYSEDLDFSVTDEKNYDFPKTMVALVKQLELFGLPVETRQKEGVVDSSMLRFTTVLQECGLSDLTGQKLSIKIEVDTNPPKGGKSEVHVVQDQFLFPLRAHDLPSLMAGKLHAIFCRSFVKGRDYYDLMWYLTKKISPNIELLQNSISQTNCAIGKVTEETWKQKLKEYLENVDYKQVLHDVEPFLMRPEEAKLLQKEYFMSLLREDL